ncbi:PP2C family protein-serine/threonine phosphatase [Hamadaea tsunoensis]|uniref:PP2C family protein-serine/threonine phosphatase n=1 Tax=Hamadaea tsunoensis TaxID=53368 RepID=UPI00041E8381|nr:PP2C family protein-serine/threonine phosphatase [Hamadaea tsunoensis]
MLDPAGLTVLSRSEQWYEAILDLLREANLTSPDELPQLLRAVTAGLARDFTIYLVDYEQYHLRELTGTGIHDGDSQPVEGSLAGLTFQNGQPQTDPEQPAVTWIPLMDSAERLGVLRVATEVSDPDEAFHHGGPVVQFANLLGHLIAAKLPYGDRLHQTRSSRPMTVKSVLLRQLLPPSTFTADRWILSASMRPAYAIGGDAYDYALDDDIAYVGVFDAVGHGLEAGLAVAVALSATRAARRNGASLTEMAHDAEAELTAQFGTTTYVTAVMLRMDLTSGQVTYVNAGHPPVVVLGADGGTTLLSGGRRLPLAMAPDTAWPGEHQLQDGDRLLFYTDGAVDVRDADGQFYTVERLIASARALAADGQTVPETARRLNQGVVDFHGGPPDDDSTIVVCEWSARAVEDALP